METLEKEFKLAQDLKNVCDTSGKETDLAKSSEIIHKLGLVYKTRSPDKISLIQSVGLLNGALARTRNPSHVLQIESDLSEVCRHILQLSGAKKQNEDLVAKAKKIKLLINQLRQEVDCFLNSVCADPIPEDVKNELQELEENKISSMESINHKIAEEYKKIMVQLSEYCETVKGSPPCQYAVAGMGSLARKEITPYSDYEHMILLEEQNDYLTHAEYFRWISVIFHVIFLNLQETIIPSLHITSLNNTQGGSWFFDAFTTRGVSFDGMMPHACKFPLGRQQPTDKKNWTTELIKPVSEMLKYLSSEEDLKNGYHLSDILTKTCFVYGNIHVYQQFADGVQSILDKKTPHERAEEVKQQVKNDLNQFSSRFRLANLKLHSSINIKQFVYRSSTLFIAAMGRMYNISANSCFMVIKELSNKSKISQQTKHKLLYAVAIACEMRLKVYMTHQSQRDNAIQLVHQRDENIGKFLDIVGRASTINYFQITYCLQCEVAKLLNFTKLHFYTNPQLINLAICFAFGIRNFNTTLSKRNSSVKWDLNSYQFDECINQIEQDYRLSFASAPSNPNSVTNIESVAVHLNTNRVHDEALELFQYLLLFHEKASNSNNADKSIIDTLGHIGISLRLLQRYDDALKYFQRSLSMQNNLSLDVHKDRKIAWTLNYIGLTLCNLQQYNDSLSYLHRALDIYERISSDKNANSDVARVLKNIGWCLRDMHCFDESLSSLNSALVIFQNVSLDEDHDRDVAMTLRHIGRCLKELQRYDQSLKFLRKSLITYQNVSFDVDRDLDVARTFNYIGECFQDLDQHENSLSYFNQALNIFLNASLDEENDLNIAWTYDNIGKSLQVLVQFGESLNYFKKSLEIYQKASGGAITDENIAKSFNNMGVSFFGLHHFNDSLHCFEKALTLCEQIPIESLSASIRLRIEQCSIKLNEVA